MNRYVTVRIEITQDDGRPPTSVQACSQTYPRGTQDVGDDSEAEIIGKTFLAAMHGISDFVEDGYIRGFAIVDSCGPSSLVEQCQTTGRQWPPGYYVFMRADSWQWVKPIPSKGFQGFRYLGPCQPGCNGCEHPIEIVGGWRDPKPEAGR